MNRSGCAISPFYPTDTTLLFTEKAETNNGLKDNIVSIKIFSKSALINNLQSPSRAFTISTENWRTKSGFLIQSDSAELNVLSRMESGGEKLGELTDMFYGIKVYQIGKGKPPQTEKIRDTKPFTLATQKNKSFLPFFDGKHIGRYQLLWDDNNWLYYGPWVAEPRFPEKFEGEKLLVRKIVADTLIATYIPKTSYCNTLLYVVKIHNDAGLLYKFLLGILCSRLLGWYFRKKFQISFEDTFPQILLRDMMQFPIPLQGLEAQNKMVSLVERMLALHRRSARTPQEQEMIQREIESTDRAIDALVYELYGLTEDEVKIVERG